MRATRNISSCFDAPGHNPKQKRHPYGCLFCLAVINHYDATLFFEKSAKIYDYLLFFQKILLFKLEFIDQSEASVVH